MKILTILFLSLIAVSLQAADRTTPREIETPYPTITNLAVQWQIDGDDNLSATCEVKYRKTGEVNWHNGMPLRRVPAGTSDLCLGGIEITGSSHGIRLGHCVR